MAGITKEEPRGKARPSHMELEETVRRLETKLVYKKEDISALKKTHGELVERFEAQRSCRIARERMLGRANASISRKSDELNNMTRQLQDTSRQLQDKSRQLQEMSRHLEG